MERLKKNEESKSGNTPALIDKRRQEKKSHRKMEHFNSKSIRIAWEILFNVK